MRYIYRRNDRVVFGTAGSVDLNAETGSLLIDKYRTRFGGEVEFDTLRPLNILSENMQPDDLKTMEDCINNVDKEAYDGIILTHGTDTLCFTANLFSQIFCDIPIPLVLVSALYPLDDERSRGVENFAGAVTFIESVDYGGVFVSFENSRRKLQDTSCKQAYFRNSVSRRIRKYSQRSVRRNKGLEVCVQRGRTQSETVRS